MIKAGDKLEFIFGPEDSDNRCMHYRVGHAYSSYNCESITIEEMRGQMAMVPVARVTFADKPDVYAPLHMLESWGAFK